MQSLIPEEEWTKLSPKSSHFILSPIHNYITLSMLNNSLGGWWCGILFYFVLSIISVCCGFVHRAVSSILRRCCCCFLWKQVSCCCCWSWCWSPRAEFSRFHYMLTFLTQFNSDEVLLFLVLGLGLLFDSRSVSCPWLVCD